MKRMLLQKFRNNNNLTQEQMAYILGITVSTYKAIEYGQRNPSYKLLLKIRTIFPNMDIDKIFLSDNSTNSIENLTQRCKK